MKKVIEYYKKYPPNVLTPERALRRIAGYIYADGRNPFESNQLVFINTKREFLKDFHLCINVVSKALNLGYRAKAYALVKQNYPVEFKKFIRSVEETLSIKVKILEYEKIPHFQLRPVIQLTYSGPLAKFIVRLLKTPRMDLSVDGLATYLNGDGYWQIRGDKKGLIMYAKEPDIRIINILAKQIKKWYGLTLGITKLKGINSYRVHFSLSIFTTASLLIYGCIKAKGAMMWHINNNRYFKYIDKLPDVFSIRDPVVKRIFGSSSRLRRLRRNGYIEYVYMSKGNKPSLYQLTPLFKILREAVIMAKCSSNTAQIYPLSESELIEENLTIVYETRIEELISELLGRNYRTL